MQTYSMKELLECAMSVKEKKEHESVHDKKHKLQ